MPRFDSYEDLQSYLRNFTNFGGDLVPYDLVGAFHLLLALVDNLRENSLEAGLEDVGELLTEEQAAFLARLAASRGIAGSLRKLSSSGFFFARATGRVFASEYAGWAASMLEGGFDSPSLRILAGLDGGGLFEAEDFLRRALRELRWPDPDLAASAHAYARALCEAVLTEALEPREGVRRLSGIARVLDYPPDYQVWNRLNEGLEIGERGFDETVRAEARDFLKSLK